MSYSADPKDEIVNEQRVSIEVYVKLSKTHSDVSRAFPWIPLTKDNQSRGCQCKKSETLVKGAARGVSGKSVVHRVLKVT